MLLIVSGRLVAATLSQLVVQIVIREKIQRENISESSSHGVLIFVKTECKSNFGAAPITVATLSLAGGWIFAWFLRGQRRDPLTIPVFFMVVFL